jgi:hypothetical protein
MGAKTEGVVKRSLSPSRHYGERPPKCPRCKGTDITIVPVLRSLNGLSAVEAKCSCGCSWMTRNQSVVRPVELRLGRSA